MGLYTNSSRYVSSDVLDYTNVPTYFTEGNINFQELGIVAAAECRQNSNAIIKAIGINELAYLESTGSPEVIYEASGIKNVFEKIKMVFRKIIEKVKKIFHTFMAKMQSIFINNKDFANKYSKEVIRKWANVSNEWSISGYKFTIPEVSASEKAKNMSKEQWKTIFDNNVPNHLLDVITLTEFPSGSGSVMKQMIEGKNLTPDGKAAHDAASTDEDKAKVLAEKDSTKALNKDDLEAALAAARDKKEDVQEKIRGYWVTQHKSFSFVGGSSGKTSEGDTVVERGDIPKYDASEYTEELFKLFRNGDDSKDDLEKKDIDITHVINVVKDSSKDKTNVEKAFKHFSSAIDACIKAIDREEKDYFNTIKDKTTEEKIRQREAAAVQLMSVGQDYLQFEKECGIQFESAYLQAIKDRVSFYKSIMVKVIGQSKKMTEESYDYSSQYSYDSGSSFMDSVQLV